jgi:L-lactate dehydrogenase complex protein LldE
VLPAGQTCCGLPAWSSGALKEARAIARRMLGLLAPSPQPVVVPSPACASMIRRYPELLRDDAAAAERARALAARTHELGAFLAARPELPRAGTQASARRLACQPACAALHGGGGDACLALLAGVPGVALQALPDAASCCGYGGPFAFEQPDLSGALLARKLKAVLASGALAVVSSEPGCVLHLDGALRRRAAGVRALHLAEALAEQAEPED